MTPIASFALTILLFAEKAHSKFCTDNFGVHFLEQ